MHGLDIDSRKRSFVGAPALPIMPPMTSIADLDVVSLSGSPSAESRSSSLLRFIERRLAGRGATRITHIAVRELPAQPLLLGAADHPELRAAAAAVQDAELVMVATPIYKAAYSGLLKTFLDLLPVDALRGKTVLPLATGGSTAHLLAMEYALKPVLAALGARHVLDGVFVVDTAWTDHPTLGRVPAPEVIERIDAALRGLRRPAAAATAVEPSAAC